MIRTVDQLITDLVAMLDLDTLTDWEQEVISQAADALERLSQLPGAADIEWLIGEADGEVER